MEVDVLIAGAGPAGLSAALLLGRCHRRVLICGEGGHRNRASPAIHGLLGHDGRSPADYLMAAQMDLILYPAVERRRTLVTAIEREGPIFRFRCSDGTQGTAKKILLATGVVDDLPELPGIEKFYGVSVHHCLYCDGFEYGTKSVVAYGKGDKGAGLALMMKHWVQDVILCTGGERVTEEVAGNLRSKGIPVRAELITALTGEKGRLESVEFAQGPPLSCQGLFFATGCRQASELSRELGCARDEKGGVITDPATEETTAPGVFVAGDASRDVLLVAIAVAEGAKAAVAINKSLLRSEGLCD